MWGGVVVLFAAIIFSSAANAGRLVGKWDFNNYDPQNPTSAAILAPSVGNLSAIPCTGTSSSVEVTDGTLGSIGVVNTGLQEGDWALSIPKGSHIKIPLPSGIVHDKSWMLRLRFYCPSAQSGKLRSLIVADMNTFRPLWCISWLNLIQGDERVFGTAGEENGNSINGMGVQKQNGAKDFRLVSPDTWHSFTAHFGPTGASSTLDGYRSVSLWDIADVRSQFTTDGFLVCAGENGELCYISSVEVWEDTPIYRDVNGPSYVSADSRTVFANCSILDIRDMYISVKGLGSWNNYGRVMSSWEHIVSTDDSGKPIGVKIDCRGRKESDAILLGFDANGENIDGNSLRMQWSLAWPNPYFTINGDFTSSSSHQVAPSSWDGNGYSPFNIYALPFRPLDGSVNWSMQMGTGKFGNPIFSIVGDNPTLTFDADPYANSLTLDCGRGDGHANVRFAYASDNLKVMSSIGELKITDGVTLTVPDSVVVGGMLSLTSGAKMLIDIAGISLSNGDVLFTAGRGILLPTGKTISDLVEVPGGSVKLSDDCTQILLVPDKSIVVTAVWTGLGDRNNVSDPLNWTCYNYAGAVLDGELPGKDTSITISGPTNFNIPAGQSLSCMTLLIKDCTLSSDCDWSGLGTVLPIVEGATVDLNGHKLTVAGLDNANVATIKNDNQETVSVFCVNNATDTTNTHISIAGNIKFVKDGVGAFSSTKAQSYTGGTEILGGTVNININAVSVPLFGPQDSSVLVRDATLQFNDVAWFSYYKIVLDRGNVLSTYSNSITTEGGSAIFGHMDVVSDSTLRTTGNGNLRIWNGYKVDLGGHTLDVDIASSGNFIVASNVDRGGTTITNGTLNVSGGVFMVYPGYAGTVEARGTKLRMNCAMNIPDTCTFNVDDYEALYNGLSNAGTGMINVYGTFKPSAHDYFYAVNMRHESVIDLSMRTTALPSVSAFAEGANALTYGVDNDKPVTIYVSLGERKLPSNTQIISWAEKPANIDKVHFKVRPGEGSRLFVKKDDGLYTKDGFMITIK